MRNRSAYRTFILVILSGFIPGSAMQAIADPAGEIRMANLAEPKPAQEPVGDRPYEMVRANRKPDRTPLVNFDSLDGWSLECLGGAVARAHPSSEQRVWESNTAKLIYRGTGKDSAVILRPPAPIPLGNEVECVHLWVYGNNWGYSEDPKTPSVRVYFLAEDAEKNTCEIDLAQVQWKEWWLIHRKIAKETVAKLGDKGVFTGLKIVGGSNSEDRAIFLEDLTVFKEDLKPLQFDPRPKRGIEPFPGQSVGANTGPGQLPFPARKETILPKNYRAKYRNTIQKDEDGTFRFIYKGKDAELEYRLHPGHKDLGYVEIFLDGTKVANGLVGAGVLFEEEPKSAQLTGATLENDVVRLVWSHGVESHLRIWQKSLVVDFFCQGGKATELAYGKLTEGTEPELFQLPYINYGQHHLCVLALRGEAPCFASVWMDWYQSNGSKPYATDEIKEDGIYLNGGVRYLPRTDGVRNDLFERVFFTVSPMFEETLCTIPNPPAKEGYMAGQRLWQESWGPSNYEDEMKRSEKLRAYGIEMLTQCNHEITWRDEGESFTFRTEAAPGKGGDEALKKYIAHQKSLGWRAGLYTNYCDFSPVNAYWNEDWVMRDSSGEWIRAWYRCYSPKALRAVETDAKIAPIVQEKFGTDAAYTDVHTSVSPWDRTDYDARVPGAGTFASTFYAYGELLLHDQDVYKNHCWSEGNHQWLYTGLTTGNYGLTYSNLNLWEYPYLPHFDLLKMHPLTVDIGMPWTAGFFQRCEGWNKPERIVKSIDQFIAATIAYGHIGWLVEEGHGIRQTCRSYYMLQQLQSRYVMQEPEVILYGTNEDLISSSEAFLTGQWRNSRLFIRYPNGLRIWVNGNDKRYWTVDAGKEQVTLSPFGWVAIKGREFFEKSSVHEGHRADLVGSPMYVYVDGRGQETEYAGIRTSGAVAVRPAADGETGLSIIAVEGVEKIKISKPEGRYSRGDVRHMIGEIARAESLEVEAYDVEGNTVGQASVERIEGGWRITAQTKAVRYEVGIKNQELKIKN
ncbi:MAG TPA: hypothetical protein PLQ35_08575 [bacterium]|nr:hypothetical protein [bacterium]HQL62335.1 hypothetical protein [bacterium]